jgi:hypothetical protein
VRYVGNTHEDFLRCEKVVEWNCQENLTEFKLVFNERAWDFPVVRTNRMDRTDPVRVSTRRRLRIGRDAAPTGAGVKTECGGIP